MVPFPVQRFPGYLLDGKTRLCPGSLQWPLNKIHRWQTKTSLIEPAKIRKRRSGFQVDEWLTVPGFPPEIPAWVPTLRLRWWPYVFGWTTFVQYSFGKSSIVGWTVFDKICSLVNDVHRMNTTVHVVNGVRWTLFMWWTIAFLVWTLAFTWWTPS